MDNMTEIHAELSIQLLTNGMLGVTSHLGGCFIETCSVCLEDQGHKGSTTLHVDGCFNTQYTLRVPSVTDQMKRAWGDSEEATELGATGLAILVILDITNLCVVRRMYKGSGFDYWLGENSDEGYLLQNHTRLEVSGIRKGTRSQIKSRVKQKLDQVSPSDDWGYPAYIVVVEFSRPLASVEKK